MSHQHCLFYLFLMVALAKSCQCVVCRPIVLSVTFYGVFEVTTIFIIISEYYLPFLVLTSAVMVQKQWWVNFWHLSTSRGWDAKLLAVTVFFTALDTHFKVFWMLKLKVCRKQSCCVLWRSLSGWQEHELFPAPWELWVFWHTTRSCFFPSVKFS